MKNIKTIFLILAILTAKPTIASEGPQHPPCQNLATLPGLPAELQRKIVRMSADCGPALRVDFLAKSILGLAGSNRALRIKMNNFEYIVQLLHSLPKPAALQLAKKLAKLPTVNQNILEILKMLPSWAASWTEYQLSCKLKIKYAQVIDMSLFLWQNQKQDTLDMKDAQDLFTEIRYRENPDLKKIETWLKKPNLFIDFKNPKGKSSLLVSYKRGNATIVAMLIAAGADVNTKDHNKTTPLMYACRNHPEITKQLLAAGANPNAKDNVSESALTKSLCEEDVESSLALIAASADINTPNNIGRTPLMHAVCADNPQKILPVINALLAAGADAELEAHGLSALDLARNKKTRSPEIIQILEEALAARKV